MPLLRANLLAGRRLAVAGGADAGLSQALLNLGAEVEVQHPSEVAVEEEQVGEWARERRPLHGVVYAAGSSFGSGGDQALLTTLDEAWAAVREVAVGALIEAEHPSQVILVGPHSDAGRLAGAVQAGLENLARTLSVEWARYGVTAVMLAPGPRSTHAQLATLVSFLVSEGGGYLSGCRLALGELA